MAGTVKGEKLTIEPRDTVLYIWDLTQMMRKRIKNDIPETRERALALTKLDEFDMWLGRSYDG